MLSVRFAVTTDWQYARHSARVTGKMLPPTERAGLREYLEETRRGLSRFAPYFDSAVWTCSVSHLVRRAARGALPSTSAVSC